MSDDINLNDNLEQHVQNLINNYSDDVTKIISDPSLALYRINENVQSSIRSIVTNEITAEEIRKKLEGGKYDEDSSIEIIKNWRNLKGIFDNIISRLETVRKLS